MRVFGINWRLMGFLTVAVLVFASLFLPPRVEEMRSGYWAIEHFLAYFLATFVIFMGWRRPLAVAGSLVFLGVLLEALQCLEPTHSPNVYAALGSVSGVLVALPFAVAFRARERGPIKSGKQAAAERH
jgi:VanZ family protein